MIIFAANVFKLTFNGIILIFQSFSELLCFSLKSSFPKGPILLSSSLFASLFRRDSTVSWLFWHYFCIFIQYFVGFEPKITSYLSAFSVFLSVGEFWDSFGQRGQGLEPLEDHIAKLRLQFKTVEAVRRTCLHLD